MNPSVNRLLRPIALRLQDRALPSKTSSATKTSQRLLYIYYRHLADHAALRLQDAGCRVFSEFEEDGKLLFIFATLGISSGTFVDIGSADGIRSNCANLALNFGWHGVFIDADDGLIRRGRRFYARHPDTRLYPPVFIRAVLTPHNVNDMIRQANLTNDVDLLSIDIDGNDYWIWSAITAIEPKVIIIECYVEWGLDDKVTPYREQPVRPAGASPVAMTKLAETKGYRLVGSNAYGFNLVYLKRGLAEGSIPTMPIEAVLAHPRNRSPRCAPPVGA